MKPPTPDQLALVRYFADGKPCTMPYRYRPARQWVTRRGFIENTRVTNGIASTVGGVQWLYRITPAGRALLARQEAQP
jgi:hypothetical protein